MAEVPLSPQESDDLGYSPLAVIGRRIRAKELSSHELTTSMLERIRAANPVLNCFATVSSGDALRQARQLDDLLSRGSWMGPLHGIPIALKDNIATEGIRTTAGSPILRDWLPSKDAAVVARLKREGAVIVGKTTMWEFAYGDWSREHGEARNPWDLTRTCATSSTGSACAVAAGLVYGSLGTDVGGSIRLPGAVCGVLGLKPTKGLVACEGVVPVSETLDHVGPLARNVGDLTVLLACLTGTPIADAQAALEQDLGGIVIGVPDLDAARDLDEDVRGGCAAALDVLQRGGAVLRRLELPDHRRARAAMWAISAAEAAATHGQLLQERPGDYAPGVVRQLRMGQFLPAVDYVQARRFRERLRARYAELMRDVDVIALPVLPIRLWKAGETMARVGSHLEPVMSAITRYCPAFNLTGQPALSVPCGLDRDGLPLAFQLVGRLDEDALIMRVASAYERATDWHLRRPPYGRMANWVGNGSAKVEA